MDARSHFSGKRITVMGLGLLGRGVGDVRFLASMGADLIVTDIKSEEELAPSLASLKEFPNITYALGGHRFEDFRDRDAILQAAGVPFDSPYLLEAKKQGIPIKMSASWFSEIANIPVVGVTGTRGKSTVTHFIETICKTAGKPFLLGGNVRGVSTLSLLPDVTPEHTAVFELDSWQLQGFGEAKLSPGLAVFTTFFQDHLNYYGGDLERYLEDKAQVFLNQKPGDTLIAGSQVAGILKEKYGAKIKGRFVVADDLPEDWTLKIPGAHNRYNAGIAVAAARVLGINEDIIKTAVESFAGVPGRLELLREIDGVSYYNDTNATTPEATAAGLTALNERHPGKVVLITGGADKALDMTLYIDAVKRHAAHVALLKGTGTDRVKGELVGAQVFDDLKGALEDAQGYATEGGAVVLSPGFASFGMFKNEYDRGDQWNALIEAL